MKLFVATAVTAAAFGFLAPAPVQAQSNEGYVSLNQGAGIAIIEPVGSPLGINVLATVPIAGSSALNGIAVTPNGETVYVAGGGFVGRVWVIDTLTRAVLPPLAGIPVGILPEGVAISPNGDFVFVAHPLINLVSIIEVATNTVVNTVNVTGAFAVTAVETDSGVFVYVAASAAGNVAVIDIADPINPVTTIVVATIDVKLPPVTGAAGPQRITATPDGSAVYVSDGSNNLVVKIDTTTNTIAARINVTGSPFGIGTNADGSRVYVAIRAPRDVAVIDTSDNSVSFVGLDAPVSDPVGLAVTPDSNFVVTANQATNRMTVIDATSTPPALDDVTVVVAAPGRGGYVAFLPATPPPPLPPDVPPTWDPGTLEACGAPPIAAQVGIEMTLTVSASDPTDVLTLRAPGGVPAGASLTESLPAVGNGSVGTRMTWTPGAVGLTNTKWIVEDADGKKALPVLCKISINVKPAPVVDHELDLSLRSAKVSTRGRFADFFLFKGYFTVDTTGGNNIDLETDPVVIQIESQEFEIAPNAFKGHRRGHRFRFKGTFEGGAKLLVHINRRGRHGNRYNIRVIGWKTDLKADGKLQVCLQIGDDSGCAEKHGRIR